MTQTSKATETTAQTTAAEYVGRRRSGEAAATSNYEGRRQYVAPRATEAEIMAEAERLMALPAKR